MGKSHPSNHRNKSVMAHQFSRVPEVKAQRSSFDRSHGLKTTLESGWLVPVLVDEALPGDTFNVNMTAFGRAATPIKPIMDNIFFDSFFFAVPVRLVWDSWEKFNGEKTNPDDSTEFLVPMCTTGGGSGTSTQSLHDYMGIPPNIPNIEFSALYARAYHLVFNTWFRDQNLQDSVYTNHGNQPGAHTDYELQRRGKRHDYFTSALPWPQKSDAPVTIPIGDSAPVVPIGDKAPIFASTSGFPSVMTREDADGDGRVGIQTNVPTEGETITWSQTKLQADLTGATATTINELRQAFQAQRMYERDARGGTRYTEIIRSHFGVTSPDARLQRPEYLGGGTQQVNYTPVTQNTQTAVGLGPTPIGNLAAYGTVAASNHGFTKSFTEHCIILGIVNFRADLTYQQGLNRMFSRLTRFDFYWPTFAHLGEQEIKNKEIFCDPSDGKDDEIFGYQERYAEYRYKPSMVTGKMRSSDPQSLDFWHLAQDFTERPVLNGSFIEDKPPMERVNAVDDEPEFLLDCYFSMRCARPMPLYGVPGLIDHF